MAVVRYVNQHFRADTVPNPLMENANRLRQLNCAGIFDKDFQIDVLYRVWIGQAVTFAGDADMRA